MVSILPNHFFPTKNMVKGGNGPAGRQGELDVSHGKYEGEGTATSDAVSSINARREPMRRGGVAWVTDYLKQPGGDGAASGANGVVSVR